MKKILITILLILMPSFAHAKFLVNLSNTYAQFKDRNYKIPSTNTQGLSYGLFYNINNLTFSVQTNRFFDRNNKSYVVRKRDNQLTVLKSKFAIDTVSLGYRVKKNIFSGLIMNVESKRNIDKMQKNNHSVLYGVNYSYILKKDVIISLSLIAPDKELNLKGALNSSINLLF